MPPCLLLSRDECLRVLAATCICYAAMTDDGAPYVLPLGFALDEQAQLRLTLRTGGRAARLLTRDPRLCLAFSLLHEDAVDSVLLEGCAILLAEADGCLPIMVRIASISGRRFPLRRH